MTDVIPVVDFSVFSNGYVEGNNTSQKEAEVIQQLVDALSEIGFVYLLNTSIPKDLVEEAHRVSRKFFELSVNIKAKYSASPENRYQGYYSVEHEAFDPKIPGDLKETFDFTVFSLNSSIWPTEIPDIKETLFRVFVECTRLTHQILKMLAKGLGLEDEHFFARYHHISTMDRPLGTTMRSLYYPPVTRSIVAKPGQSRLGEHTDYGTITLVLQDDAGGLQVRGGRGQGQWIDAVPIEGSVLVNIADLLQRWTNDKLVSTAHRIILPQPGEGRRSLERSRQSIAFFVQPDPDVEITCIDGSNRYPPVKAGEYLLKRLQETHLVPSSVRE